jgi:hypothetical protein
MIAITKRCCDSPHYDEAAAGERRLMATHSFGPGTPAPSNSHSGSPAWNQSYGVAALRAGLIALALLAVLALIVLS